MNITNGMDRSFSWRCMILAASCIGMRMTDAFSTMPQRGLVRNGNGLQHPAPALQPLNRIRKSQSSTLLPMVWWFGGSQSEQQNDDECELVAVRIESPTSNSRKIMGEIVAEGTPLKDVWAILTDYDRLAVHVPNLVESKTVSGRGASSAGQAGDGDYSCRLFQRGAQKIIGFEFGASVTMDMQEQILCLGAGSESNVDVTNAFPAERRITFKCVDSQFFSSFDGEWKVTEQYNALTGQTDSVVQYSVLVKPKGPVPVAALEWRIREDVPTNLRAVKKAAMEVGLEGVMQYRNGTSAYQMQKAPIRTAAIQSPPMTNSPPNGQMTPALVSSIRKSFRRFPSTPLPRRNGRARSSPTSRRTYRRQAAFASAQQGRPIIDPVNWGEDETMAAYLDK